MDFGWSDEQASTYARMRALGAAIDVAAPGDRLRLLAEGGALGLSLPRELGGGGLDLLTTARAYEGLGATLRDGGALLAAGAHLFGVAMVVARVGTPEQRAEWLPGMASGAAVATVAATEAEAGSDVSSVRCVAVATDGGFRVTGKKCFVTNAAASAVYLVVARDGGEGQGVTTLLVPRDATGVTVGAELGTAGLAGARLAPVAFDDVRVSAGAALGKPGAGRAVFQIAMTLERALVLAFRLGALERSIEEAVRFARTREIGGGPIARHQAVSHRIARMKLGLETARLLVYRAAWMLDRGERAQAEAALAKWHVADVALEAALDAARLRGGVGTLEESGLPGAIDDAFAGTVHSGTEDVLATIVARWLGL